MGLVEFNITGKYVVELWENDTMSTDYENTFISPAITISGKMKSTVQNARSPMK